MFIICSLGTATEKVFKWSWQSEQHRFLDSFAILPIFLGWCSVTCAFWSLPIFKLTLWYSWIHMWQTEEWFPYYGHCPPENCLHPRHVLHHHLRHQQVGFHQNQHHDCHHYHQHQDHAHVSRHQCALLIRPTSPIPPISPMLLLPSLSQHHHHHHRHDKYVITIIIIVSAPSSPLSS